MPSPPSPATSAGAPALLRVVGVGGAVALGLGSILGTGIFVSLGIGAGIAGPGVLAAVALAAGVATCNGLSSAQLAASHPVSGGTYEYGRRFLTPTAGFVAGLTFLCAKSASAATAALGFAGYVLEAAGVEGRAARVALAEALVVGLTLLVVGGMRRSARANVLVVGLTLAALGAFVAAGLPVALEHARERFTPFLGPEPQPLRRLLHATALLFVAYTGYGRVATLGEEIREPARNIPRAIVATLLATAALYALVAFVAIGVAGAPRLAEATAGSAAPLEAAARGLGVPGLGPLVALGAMTAMAGVSLNLVLGLSRVLLAMARRGDAPASLARVDASGSPRAAVLATGAAIASLVLLGDVRATWSFSAFTVLVYYALTNLAALRLPPDARRFPRSVAATGLVACAGLAFWVEPATWASGLGLVALGLVVRALVQRCR